jgi:hypothetical protein
MNPLKSLLLRLLAPELEALRQQVARLQADVQRLERQSLPFGPLPSKSPEPTLEQLRKAIGGWELPLGGIAPPDSPLGKFGMAPRLPPARPS